VDEDTSADGHGDGDARHEKRAHTTPAVAPTADADHDYTEAWE
jgi:hypothetical protein